MNDILKTNFLGKITMSCLSLMFIFTHCNKTNSEQTAVESDTTTVEISISQIQYKNAGIVLGKIEKMSLPIEVKANGVLDVPPQNLASVSVPMGGYVRKTSALPGTHVHKGEILAELENLEFIRMQQEYLMAINSLEMANIEFQRQKELAEKDITSKKEFQNATMVQKNAQALVASLEQQLGVLGVDLNALKKGKVNPSIKVKSPIDGNVKSVNVTLGKYVDPMDALYEIVDNSHMHLELKVFENDILKVKEGQKIVFKIQSAGDESLGGYVYLVGKTFDNTTRTVLVHGHLDKEDKSRLIPGMFVEARIITENKQAYVLPEEALIREDNSYFLFVKKKASNGQVIFEKRPVSVANITKEKAMISGELEDLKNQEIAIKGAYFIKAEMNREEE